MIWAKFSSILLIIKHEINFVCKVTYPHDPNMQLDLTDGASCESFLLLPYTVFKDANDI